MISSLKKRSNPDQPVQQTAPVHNPGSKNLQVQKYVPEQDTDSSVTEDAVRARLAALPKQKITEISELGDAVGEMLSEEHGGCGHLWIFLLTGSACCAGFQRCSL